MLRALGQCRLPYHANLFESVGNYILGTRVPLNLPHFPTSHLQKAGLRGTGSRGEEPVQHFPGGTA